MNACIFYQIDEVMEGVGEFKGKLPTLLVLNKKDLIKPGEIAKKIEVYLFTSNVYLLLNISW